jgi:hypothetical protein
VATINSTIDRTVLLGNSSSGYPLSPTYASPLTVGLNGTIVGNIHAPGVVSGTAGVQLTNDGSITGGVGSQSGATTFFGRAGVQFDEGGTVVNTGAISGGGGGGNYVYAIGGAGINGATQITNTGGIQGGSAARNGGQGVVVQDGTVTQTGQGAFIRGGDSSGVLGLGGDGMFVTGAVYSSVYNENGATIAGGSGTAQGGIGIADYVGSKVANHFGHIVGGSSTSGSGGIGVVADGHATVVNQYGSIAGGASTAGTGGIGVQMYGSKYGGGAASSLTNSAHSTVSGGSGLSGGVGVYLQGIASVTNAGTISGGEGATNGGAGVYLVNNATGHNSGTIHGGESSVGVGGAGVKIAGNAVFTTIGDISGGITTNGGITGYSVEFSGTSSRLVVDSGARFYGNIGHFQPGNAVDFYGVSIDTLKSEFHAGSGSTDPTIVFASGTGGTLDFQGDSGDTFVFREEPDGKGAEVVVEPACYRRGTLIRTAHGEVPVEALQAGDLVVTAAGGERPVRWVGHRSMDCRRYADPAVIWPVRILAGALGDAVPARDLWVSPGHALLIDGVLVQACNLINQVTVAQESCEHVEYWHVELDSHDVLVAEGAAAESYLDTGNRTAFANGGASIDAYPDFAPKHWSETCVPLALDGEALDRARALVHARAKMMGHHIEHDSELHVVADGQRVDAIELPQSRLAFVLPPDCTSIELRSRRFVPAHVDSSSGDRRELGICVGRLQIDGAAVELENEAAFSSGWHAVEQHPTHAQRWTDGAATLPAGARLIVVQIAGRSYYWAKPECMEAISFRASA